jgi:hypothetical protein
MDLCKHTIRTVAGMMNEKDAICLITFSNYGKVVMKPTIMNEEGKAKLSKAISLVQPDSQTNIWAGIELAHRVANKPEFKDVNITMALLTDGLPNIDPPRGLINTFKRFPNETKNYSLSTFGFGYQVDSEMLENISKIGKGIFGFIPDYSMVATVFINWAASVLSTCNRNVTIKINYEDGTSHNIDTSLIQFGQNRDYIFKVENIKEIFVNDQKIEISEGIKPNYEFASYELKNLIEDYVEKIKFDDKYPLNNVVLFNKYKVSTNEKILELIKDINPNEASEGQINMAVKYYKKWGQHHMLAFLKAYQFQMCMNFKDPGLQLFGGNLFHRIQDEGDEMFSKLEVAKPSGVVKQQNIYGVTNVGSPPLVPVNMTATFHNPSGGCIQGSCRVKMFDKSFKEIKDIQKGDLVFTPNGPGEVVALVICGTSMKAQPMCNIGNLWITPWHPVMFLDNWEFPENISPIVDRQLSKVYNLVLKQNHIIEVENVLCVTLGHGLTQNKVKHEYFGTKKVIDDLKLCPDWENGIAEFKNLKFTKNENGIICKWYDEKIKML